MSYALAVPGPQTVDVAAILAAVYKRPPEEVDEIAGRVRARLALLETVSEGLRLLTEAPLAAINASIAPTEASDEE